MCVLIMNISCGVIIKRRAVALYAPVIVAAYEGGGYSETAENKRRSAAQHREITRFYMGRAKQESIVCS